MRNVYFLAMDQDDSQICLRLLLFVVSAFVCCVCFCLLCLLLFVVSALVRAVFDHKNSRNSFKKLVAKLKPFASI